MPINELPLAVAVAGGGAMSDCVLALFRGASAATVDVGIAGVEAVVDVAFEGAVDAIDSVAARARIS